MRYNWTKIGAYAGIAASLVFILFFLFAVANYERYSFTSNYLSDLGIGKASAIFFNSGVIMAGLLGIVFGYGLSGFFKKKSGLFSAITIFASLSLIGVGIFPENYGITHEIISAVFFLTGAILLIFIGLEMRKKTTFAYLDIATGLIPFVFVFTGSPLIEHLAVFGIVLWVLLWSVYVLRKA